MPPMNGFADAEHFDVLVVGAGLSGLCAAYYLQRDHPTKRFAVLEGRARLGGTWSLFQYPGIRSDSDLYTLGFSFRPWCEAKSIADGANILSYLDNTADQFGLHKYIRCRHRVRQTNFVADEAKWQLTVEVDGEQDPDEVLRAGDASQVPPKKKHVVQMSCQFLMLCSGYYRYSSGYAPAIPGLSSFTGPVVHPQLWPRDEQLELKDKRVIVIGSGATAVTLVPALAERGTKSVTMLQRSPSYMMSLPSVDPVWRLLSRFLPTYFVCHFLRIKHILFYVFTFWICRTFPTLVRRVMHGCLKCVLPTGFDMRHVTPLYKPWEQRFCLVPDGDLFRALRQGKADIVTDTIDSVIPSGIRLTSGQELPADIIVTATGLHMELGGGMAFCIDDKPVDLANSMMYRGMMLSGVPNLVVVMGYTNASWTLKCELVCQRFSALLRHMDATGSSSCVAHPGADVEPKPLLDFSSGYVQRASSLLPKQGSKGPWRLPQNYLFDVFNLRRAAIDDGVLRFSPLPRL